MIRDKEVGNMCKMHGVALGTILLVIVAGCGKTGGTGQASNAQPDPGAAAGGDAAESVNKADGPAAVVAEFLEAVRTGNDETALRMLSKATRQKWVALNRAVTPPASDTAKFTIGKVDYLEGGARVASTWTDLDADRQPTTTEAFWVVRQEDEGWRVAGVAGEAFPGGPYLILNFEDPQDMLRKLQWAREEMRRRMEKDEAGLQAQGTEKQEKSIRR
jgi:hypothetical protein